MLYRCSLRFIVMVGILALLSGVTAASGHVHEDALAELDVLIDDFAAILEKAELDRAAQLELLRDLDELRTSFGVVRDKLYGRIGDERDEAAMRARGYLAWTERSQYYDDEEIVVYFAGLPGNRTDWIALTAASRPDNQYGRWAYTQGETRGTHTFAKLSPGSYEVRVYFNWSSGGYTVHSRHAFTVVAR